MLAWGLVSGSQFWLNGRTSFLVTRFFLAATSAGFPANVLLVSAQSWNITLFQHYVEANKQELDSVADSCTPAQYLSYFYTGIELPYRMTVFLNGNRLNDIVAPLLAVGILRLRGAAGREGWRWSVLSLPLHLPIPISQQDSPSAPTDNTHSHPGSS